MALINRKIENWSNPVSNLQDKPRMTANELKAIFDSNSNEIKPAINGIIDDLTSTDGIKNIGAAVDGLIGLTVFDVFASVVAKLAERYTKTEADSKITTETKDLVQSISFDEDTGIFTFIKKDGTNLKIDTALEKVPAKFELITLGARVFLRITNIDGSTTQTDVTSLIHNYTFKSTESIDFLEVGNETSILIFANIRDAAIKKRMLAADVTSYLEELETQAKEYAYKAQQYSGKPPIIENGNWNTWNANIQSYIDTGFPARGEKGERGYDFKILGYYKSLETLKSAQPSPNAGDAYGVGTAPPYNIYIFDGITSDWINNGQLQGPKGDTGANGKDGTINGFNKVTIQAGDGIDVTSSDNTITISSNGSACCFTIGTSTAGTTSQDCDYLCDGTNDASVINQAIADLPLGGGIITLLAGTYNLKSKISLNKNNITLIGQGEVIINKSVATNSSSGIINIEGNDCLVDNIKVNGNGETYAGICIYIAGNSNCIQNCTIENVASYGINILGEFCTAKNNILTNCNYSIYTMSSSKNAILDGNVINNNPCVAIRLQGDNSIITNTVVNTTGNGYNGIEISSENAKITNNTISLCGGYGIGAKLNNITISGNKVYQNSSYGIYISASNAIVKDNTVSNNTSSGIYVISSDCQISNNTVTQNTNGIELSASASNAYISQNTSSNNSNRGIMCYAPYTEISSNYLSENTSRNIDIKGNNCSVLDNYCSGSETSIYCTSQNSKIHNNSCFEFSNYAIYAENSPNISVVANIADGGKYGISIGASDNARISENSITTASTLGIKVYSSNKIIISDNIATDSNYNLVIDNVDYSVINDNTVVSGTGQDSDYGEASIRVTGTSSYNIISNNNMMGRNYIEDVGSTGNSYFNNKYN